MSDRTYTPDEIAERFGVSPETVMAWLRAGELGGLNVSRSANSKKPRYRITSASLAAFEAARAVTPPAPRAARRKQAGDAVVFYT